MYGQKVDKYNSSTDEQLIIQIEALIVDDPISVANLNITFKASVDIDEMVNHLEAFRFFSILRDGTEKPVINVNATFISDMSIVYGST